MSIIKRIIQTSAACPAFGPYSQAVLADRTLYVSGCLGTDKNTMKFVEGGVEAQTRQALINMGHILKAAGSSFDSVVKITIFMEDIKNFSKVNDVYKEFFVNNFPARSSYQVGKLPLDAAVEIEAVALVGDVEIIPA